MNKVKVLIIWFGQEITVTGTANEVDRFLRIRKHWTDLNADISLPAKIEEIGQVSAPDLGVMNVTYASYCVLEVVCISTMNLS